MAFLLTGGWHFLYVNEHVVIVVTWHVLEYKILYHENFEITSPCRQDFLKFDGIIWM